MVDLEKETFTTGNIAHNQEWLNATQADYCELKTILIHTVISSTARDICWVALSQKKKKQQTKTKKDDT